MAETLPDQEPGEKTDYLMIGQLSIAYVMAMLAAVKRMRQGDYLDAVIVAAIFNASGEEKRGVSRNALSTILDIPFETVRRRVNALIKKKTLAEQHDGLIFVAYAPDPGPRGEPPLGELNLQQLRKLFRALKARGVDLN